MGQSHGETALPPKGDEGISSAIQNALRQLVLNQAVTALKNGVDKMLDVLYEDTKAQE